MIGAWLICWQGQSKFLDSIRNGRESPKFVYSFMHLDKLFGKKSDSFACWPTGMFHTRTVQHRVVFNKVWAGELEVVSMGVGELLIDLGNIKILRIFLKYAWLLHSVLSTTNLAQIKLAHLAKVVICTV